MSAVGLVPARGGSKGIPGKNLAPVAGRPLLAWTLDAALGARSLDRVVVSTDSPAIGAVALQAGAEVLDRPSELAADDTPMRDVVLHALQALGRPRVLVVLQPTSPLRRAEHIDEAVRLLEETGADAVVSVVEVPHRFRPVSLMRLEEGRLIPAEHDAPVLRQAKAPLYARNGPAVLALRTDALEERASLYAGDCRAFLMGPQESLDIDDPLDLEVATCLLRGGIARA